MPDRLKVIAYRLREAEQLGNEFSTCSRRKVGAVLVSSSNRILAEGYNGAPPGETHCVDGGCPRGKFTHDEIPKDADYNQFPCIAVHAEANALLRAGYERAKDGTLYVSAKPCQQCTNLIKAMEIDCVIWKDEHQPLGYGWSSPDHLVPQSAGPRYDGRDSRVQEC